MLKKIFFIIGIFILPYAVFAQSSQSGTSSTIFDGLVVQQRGAPHKYLLRDGKRWPIADRFTLNELGVSKNDILIMPRAILNRIPLGEKLKIFPPRIQGIYDMHEHFYAGGDMKKYLDVAEKLGVAKTVFLPTGAAPDNHGFKENMAALLEEQKKYPDRIIAFCSLDEADPEAPELFKKCLDEGGKGLKLMVGHPNFYDVPVDSEIMKSLFSIAQDRDVPVMVHISIVRLPKAKKQFKNLLNQFPDVRVQFAHYCSTVYNGVNLEQCAEFLDAYPNLYIDLSMGGGIGRYFKYMSNEKDFNAIRDFILKYKDRVFFGSDMIIAGGASPTTSARWIVQRMMCDISLYQEKWYRCPVMNKGEYSLLPGFAFPDDVLKKLYVDNPKRFLGE